MLRSFFGTAVVELYMRCPSLPMYNSTTAVLKKLRSVQKIKAINRKENTTAGIAGDIPAKRVISPSRSIDPRSVL